MTKFVMDLPNRDLNLLKTKASGMHITPEMLAAHCIAAHVRPGKVLITKHGNLIDMGDKSIDEYLDEVLSH